MFTADEHAHASEGGGDIIQPAELRQRLQQQQPPGRHPGLVTGVDLVMASNPPEHKFSFHTKLFGLWERVCMKIQPP